MFKGYPSGSPEIQNLSQIGPRVMTEQQQQTSIQFKLTSVIKFYPHVLKYVMNIPLCKARAYTEINLGGGAKLARSANIFFF